MGWKGIDRRRCVRVQMSFTARIRGPKVVISAYAEDISEGGIKVVIGKKLEISSIVDLEIYLKEEPIQCKGKIVWVKEVRDHSIEKGVVFSTGIEFQEIRKVDNLFIKRLAVVINKQDSKIRKDKETFKKLDAEKKAKEKSRWWKF